MLDTAEQTLKASVVYNPLDLDNRTDAEVVFQPGKSLAHYVHDLPDEVEWAIALNEVAVPREGWGLTFPKPNDRLVAIPVPHGGGGGGSSDGKSVLALVATVALSIAAPHIAGLLLPAGAGATATSLATAAVSIAGGILISAMIPPPENTNEGREERYGIDGPKNTSSEGIPFPVLYGEHAFGGNVADLYTENATDENGKPIQYLFMRVIASEGPIESIGQLYLNDQEIETFDDVEIDYRLGTDQQTISPWFNETVNLFNQNRELTTSWQTYTTTGEVDKIRLDFVAPSGLGATDNKGRKVEVTVDLEAEYAPTGTTDWVPIKTDVAWNLRENETDTAPDFKVAVNVTDGINEDPGGSSQSFYSVLLQYRIKDSGDGWRNLERKEGVIRGHTGGNLIWEVTGETDDAWEFRTLNGGSDAGVVSEVGDVWLKTPGPLRMTDNSTQVIRRTYKTGILAEGVYDIRYRRVNEPTENDGWAETVVLSDVGEIINEPISLPYTAWIGIKIKVTGQITGVPTLTGVGRGRVMPIYDHNGVLVDVAWSNNPADVALDIYMHRRYGASMEKERLDFASFAEWRDACDANGWTFDGLFYEGSNIDDALKHVYIAGHAQRVSTGAKIGVVIEEETNPTFLFDDGNIRKSSFQITYLPFADRVNDIELAFNDKNDRYRRRSVRVTNNAALSRGEPLKSSSVELKGIVDRERVLREGTLRMNMNRLVRRTASWESPIEAISCSVGDVVAVQSEMPGWGTGGRVLSGTTTELTLDKNVSFAPGKTYRVVVHQSHSSVRVGITADAQTDNLVTLPYAKRVLDTMTPARFTSASLGIDLKILRVVDEVTLLLEPGASAYDLTAITDGRIQEIDYLNDVEVVNPAVASVVGTNVITLAAPLDKTVETYANYIFGETAYTKKPFRIKSIKRATKGHVQINAVEYVPEVYSDDPEAQAHNYSSLVKSAHVTNLTFEENLVARDSTYVSRAVLRWDLPEEGVYTGAEIQVSINGDAYETIGRTTGMRYGFRADKGDVIIARVVSLTYADNSSLSAPAAPTATLTIAGVSARPDTPTGLTASPFVSGFALTWTPSTDIDLRAYELYVSASSTAPADGAAATFTVVGNRLEVADIGESVTRHCWIRQVDAAGNKSLWSSRVSVTTGKIEDSRAAPDVPDSLTLASAQIGVQRSEVTASWAAVSDAAYYEIGITRTGGDETITAVAELYHEFEAVPGDHFTIRIRARNVLNKPSNWSATQTVTAAVDTTPPDVPPAPTLTPGLDTIEVRIAASSAPDFSHFQIVYKTSSGTPAINPASPIVTTSGTTAIITGLGSGNTRYVFVRAVDRAGNRSGWSTVTSTTTLKIKDVITSADVEGIVDATSFASGIAPVEIFDGPAFPSIGNFEGRAIILKSDGLLYRYVSDGLGGFKWTTAVKATEIIGQLITGQIAAGAISAEQMAVGAMTAKTVGIGDFTNLWLDQKQEDEEYASVDPASHGSAVLTFPSVANTNFLSPKIATITANAGNIGIATAGNIFSIDDQGEEFLYDFVASIENGKTGAARLRLKVSTSPDLSTDVAFYFAEVTSNGPTRLEGTFTVPAGYSYGVIQLVKSTAGDNTRANFGLIQVRRKNAGKLVVAGSLTADRLDTNSMNAAGLATFGGDLKSANFDGVIGENAGEIKVIDPGTTGFAITQDGYGAFNGMISREDLDENAASDGGTLYEAAGEIVGSFNSDVELITMSIGAQVASKPFQISFSAEYRGQTSPISASMRIRGWQRTTVDGVINAWSLIWDTGSESGDSWVGKGFTYFQSFSADNVEFMLTAIPSTSEANWSQNNVRRKMIYARSLQR